MSQISSQSQQVSAEEMILTQNQLTFWESKYGKEILEWCEEPNLCTKVFSKDLVLYYCEGTVYIKNADEDIEEVIDQISINPELIRFDGNELHIPF